MNTFLRISFFSLIVTLTLVLPAMAAGQAVTAVAAEGDTAEAAVSNQAARAPYFLLFDEQGELVEALANPYRETAGGAGPLVAGFLAEKGIRTFIAAETGPRMEAVLHKSGIEIRTATGSAASAVGGTEKQ